MRWPVVVLVAVLVPVLLSGCSAAGGSAPGPSGSPPAPEAPARVAGLTADLVQQRRDLEQGRIQVELTLAADAAAVDVTAVQLTSPAFPEASAGGPVLLQPGAVVDVPVTLGTPSACDAPASGTALPATAVLALGGGSSAEVALPDAGSHLARAHEEACRTAAAAAVVPARWDPSWTTTGGGADLRAVGVLHLGPVAPGGATVLEGVGATPLFQWRLPGGPVRLAAGQSADVTVVLDPARCDAHAVADDKRGFGPQLQLSLDGAPAVPVRLWVPRPERAVATDALLTACAAAEGRAG